ncbi:MAG TPA: group 1 truncated hemoglobin [Xanthobacteraceae bacterium]|jgi:hemoglobin
MMSEREASANIGDSLYKRLGGYDAIAAAVSDLMPRLRSDPKLWVYWKGKSLESRRRGDQLLVDFLCAAFGGPAFYAGPDMKTSHEGLGITNEEWDITLGHIGAALDALGVATQEKSEVLAAAASLKGDIVEA